VALFDKQFAKPTDWSWDGRLLAVEVTGPQRKTMSDIWIVPVSGDAKPYAFLASEFDELYPSFSPDGKWLSYLSSESGRPELYVRPFPGPGTPSQVSVDGTGGGGFSGNGLEVFFGSMGTDEATAVDLSAGANGLQVGRPRALFKTPTFTAIAVTHDGKRFLLAVPPGTTEAGRIGLVSNWTAGLK
jgi:serine/threonine-protein kinase